jgi:type II secretory pathway pseudopilin PulG
VPAEPSVASSPRPEAAPPGRRGLSRAETCFLLGFLLLVISIVVPSWFAIRHRQRLAMARGDLASLLAAGARFAREYGGWPTEYSGSHEDVRYGRLLPNAAVLNALRSVDGPGNEAFKLNAQKMVFIEVEPYRPGWSGLSADGSFLDPWGVPYEIVFDTDFDNVCVVQNSIYGRLGGQGMVAWSCGPDRISDTADDILSWKR